MTKLILAIAFLCISCGGTFYGAQEAEYQSPGALTLEEVRLVERRLPCLKVGMTRVEVKEVIGSKAAGKAFSGSGPRGDLRVIHHLRNGYNLVLVWDEEDKFKRAEMAGEKWRKEQEEKQKAGGVKGSPTTACTRPD